MTTTAPPLPRTNKCPRCGERFHSVHVCAQDIKLMPANCTTSTYVAIMDAMATAAKHRCQTGLRNETEMQTAPPLPEPYKAPPSMFCIACGAPYEVSRAIAPMAAGGNPLFTSSLCKCGSNQFKGTFGGETVCPQFTCDQITERDAYWIERLEEIEKIRDYEEDEATKFAHQVVELQKCLRAAEADARLYRWLSDHCVLVVEDLRSTLPGIAITVRAQSWTECADSSALKNAIDRAMGSTTSGEV